MKRADADEARRIREIHRRRNRKVGQGGEVRGPQAGVIRQFGPIFHNVSIGIRPHGLDRLIYRH
jgi:hypothetical protein